SDDFLFLVSGPKLVRCCRAAVIEATNGDRMRHGALIVSVAALSTLFSCSSAPQVKASPAPSSPIEDIKYANEWPSPNGDLYNTRVAHTTISSSNVSKLAVTWTVPLTDRK